MACFISLGFFLLFLHDLNLLSLTVLVLLSLWFLPCCKTLKLPYMLPLLHLWYIYFLKYTEDKWTLPIKIYLLKKYYISNYYLPFDFITILSFLCLRPMPIQIYTHTWAHLNIQSHTEWKKNTILKELKLERECQTSHVSPWQHHLHLGKTKKTKHWWINDESAAGHEAWVSDCNSPQKSCLSPAEGLCRCRSYAARFRGWDTRSSLKGGLVSQHSGRLKTTPVTRVSVCVLRCDQIGPTARSVKRPTYADLNEASIQFWDPRDSPPHRVSRWADIEQNKLCLSLRSLFLLWVSAPWS